MLRRHAVLAVLLFAAPPAWSAEPQYYSITVGDKLIGYATTDVRDESRQGQPVRCYANRTYLKVALLGTRRDMVLESETVMDPQSQRPVSYRATNKSNDVVTVVEAEFTAEVARCWTYRQGDDKGAAREIALPAGPLVVLGSNNFCHWQLILARAATSALQGRAEIAAFLPEVAQVDQLVLVRGELQKVQAGGQQLSGTLWQSTKPELSLLAATDSGAFLRLTATQQRTVVQRTDPQVAERVESAQAEEVLANQFLQSNVTFDDFMKVTQLAAQVDVQVIGSGVANDVTVLQTPMQVFSGQKSEDRVTGTMQVKSVTYDPAHSPAFPLAVTDSALQPYLTPADCIESDHASITAKSAELVKGVSSRWEAVLAIGRWVHQEIAYKIADSPSARLALETRTGDCGPHSTLMIALLRAAGIPARLVGGVIYTPSLGGSFGQHAWVEVFMGPSGWVSLDPTTGELDHMNATHLKFFEGLGGVRPQKIVVQDYQPQNSAQVYATPDQALPLSWRLDTQYQFEYFKAGSSLGTESFQITRPPPPSKPVLHVSSQVKLKINALASLNSTTQLEVAENGAPVNFERDYAVMLKKTKVACTFQDQKAHVEISGSQSLSRELDLPPGVFCFDNNLMSSWTLVCAQLPLELNKPLTIRTFHPSSLQIISLTITPSKLSTIKVGDADVECLECEVSPIQNTFWITRDRRFVRAAQGDLDIRLKTLDPE